MVKRFYHGILSLRFSVPMTMLAFMVFVVAFIHTRKQVPALKIVIGIIAVILLIVMFFYYKNKLSISKALHQVQNIEEYENAGVVDNSFILEDRMICCSGFRVAEHSTTGIEELVADDQGRKVMIHLKSQEGLFDLTASDMDEAQRFAAFIRRKNPDAVINIETKGDGTLKELGAGVRA